MFWGGVPVYFLIRVCSVLCGLGLFPKILIHTGADEVKFLSIPLMRHARVACLRSESRIMFMFMHDQ